MAHSIKKGRWSQYIVIILAGFLFARSASAQTPAELRDLALKKTNSLKTVPIPEPSHFHEYVKDRPALQALGKALFWDQQVGSDGQACASCHYHAGVDNRSKNQINPGLRNQTAQFPHGDTHFANSPIPGVPSPPFGPNYQLTAGDFPLHLLSDPGDRNSTVLRDVNDIISSQGVFNAIFKHVGIPFDSGIPDFTGFGAIFRYNNLLVRNVEPRNTPGTINAIFNQRNFWDGRARKEFNGVNPIGDLDPTVKIVIAKNDGHHDCSQPEFIRVRINNSSVASQADGPPLSDLEMSFAGRSFPEVGRKLLDHGVIPLNYQKVAANDSVLGPISKWPNRGIAARYAELVKHAINEQWWDAPGWVVDVSGSKPVLKKGSPGKDRFTVMEYNFSLFFGLAVQEYEKLLVSDDSPFDRFMEGDLTALNPQQQQGLLVFLTKGKCINCHGGPELTNAAITHVKNEPIERMLMGNGRIAVYDSGFYNIGVRPTLEDIGVGGRIGPKNLPLAESRRYQEELQRTVAWIHDHYPSVPEEEAVRLANKYLEIPRLPANLVEAESLLRRGAHLLSDPPAVIALLDQALVLLAQNPPDVPGATALLVQASELLKTLAQGTPFEAQIAVIREEAALLLPDPINPGDDPEHPYAPPLQPHERIAVDGALKTPTVRNVEFSAPYFRNGGQANLEQLVQFYDRGGDFALWNLQDLDPDIEPLHFTDSDEAALVAFLKATSDDRVRWERAPFDHPSMLVPNGGSGTPSKIPFGAPVVTQDYFELPAVGATGSEVPLGTPGTPFRNFLQP